MKLDARLLRFLSSDEFKLLSAIETGQTNYELVPTHLVSSLAHLRHGGVSKYLNNLHRHKLLHHETVSYDSYRLTTLGLDFIALKHLTKLKTYPLVEIGSQIGVGKESDIFKANYLKDDDNEQCVLKIHRLGRTSFRAVRNCRDYTNKKSSWLTLSKISARKEFEFMKILKFCEFPIPEPLNHDRHIIMMELMDGCVLNLVKEIVNQDLVETLFLNLIQLITKFARYGLIHGDFNEFNLIVDDQCNVTVIDFPQMVSINHPNAQTYFDRDVECIKTFFEKRFDYISELEVDFVEVCTNVNQPKKDETKKFRTVFYEEDFFLNNKFSSEYENVRIDLIVEASGCGVEHVKEYAREKKPRNLGETVKREMRNKENGVQKGQKMRMSRNVVKKKQRGKFMLDR